MPKDSDQVAAVIDGKPWQVAGTPVLVLRIGRLATITTAPAVSAGQIDPRSIQLQFDPDATGTQDLSHACDGSAPCIEFTDAHGKHVADGDSHAALRIEQRNGDRLQGTFSATAVDGASLFAGRFSVRLGGG